MLNSVDGAYFGHSSTGWISTELFYSWIVNRFAKCVSVRPVVLLVDGHLSRIDLHTSGYIVQGEKYPSLLSPSTFLYLTKPLDASFL